MGKKIAPFGETSVHQILALNRDVTRRQSSQGLEDAARLETGGVRDHISADR
jgi:hypothetical protein